MNNPDRLKIIELEKRIVELEKKNKELNKISKISDKSFYQSVIDTLNFPVYVVDIEKDNVFRYRLSNKFNVELTGIPFEKVKDKTPDSLEPFIGKEGKEAILKLYNSCIDAKETLSFEMQFPFKGENKWYFNRITPLIDDSGKIYRLIGTGLDISDRKEIEIKLKENEGRLNDQLEKYQKLNSEYILQNNELQNSIEEVKQINEELAIAKQKAEESDLLKSSFLANMSHEIRTPMNGILGFTDLLKETNITQDNAQRYIKLIEQSGIRMQNIINDLIDIAKIESGQVNLHIDDVNINSILKETYDFFHPEAKQKGLDLHFSEDLVFNEAIVKTDNQKLIQIINNLVKNALKFTNEGHIKFGYRVSKEYLEFYVNDSGLGINKNVQEIIFERFRQTDTTPENSIEGIGLGLSICKAYVTMLGGKIWVESEEGAGSTFKFTIPYLPENKDKTKLINNPESKLKSKLKGKRVLIAEDDEISFLFLREILTQFQINFVRTKNGKEAIETFKKDPSFDIFLLDTKMPILNGLDATKQIKRNWSEIPVIIQSAFSTKTDINKAIKAGADAFIPKPVKKNTLVEKIAELLHKKSNNH